LVVEVQVHDVQDVIVVAVIVVVVLLEVEVVVIVMVQLLLLLVVVVVVVVPVVVLFIFLLPSQHSSVLYSTPVSILFVPHNVTLQSVIRFAFHKLLRVKHVISPLNSVVLFAFAAETQYVS
jgi:hypothetical protein